MLAPASLRVRRVLHIVMELADGYRPVTVLFPPGREQVGDRLSAPVTLLRLAHPLGRVLTAKSEQRITYPPAPLSEAAEREARLDGGRNPPPPPNCKQRCQQLRAPVRHLDTDVGRERSRLRVLGARIEIHRNEAARQVFREGEAIAGQDHKGRCI